MWIFNEIKIYLIEEQFNLSKINSEKAECVLLEILNK